MRFKPHACVAQARARCACFIFLRECLGCSLVLLVLPLCIRLVVVGKLSSLLTVKTLTGMTTDVYPRENCIAPAMFFGGRNGAGAPR